MRSIAGGVAALTLAVLIGFLLAGGPGDEGPAFRDFTEIQAGPVVVEPDPSGTAAGLRVSTTIDVVCSVVYGPTTAFGGLATDDDMAGGGHRDHLPLMIGLEPVTTYFFRVQGVDADGTIYLSEVMEFTTPEATADTRPNLALEATVVEVSSEFSSAFAAANAIDGSLATEWATRGDGDDAYIVIDLGEPRSVTGIGFRTREMADGSSIITSYTVTVDDGKALGPFPAGPGLVVTEVSFVGRVVRIDAAASTGGNTGAVEIEIYG